jgi:hypoxanthine phosphoribosyltransferase
VTEPLDPPCPPSAEARPRSAAAGVQRVVWTAAAIAARVQALAGEITRDYAGRDLLCVGVLQGSVFFLADLVRALDVPLTTDFMAVSSYGSGVRSSGVVRILKDLQQDIEGRHVLLIEDIVDTGLTLRYLREQLLLRRPASLRICTLLDKVAARREQVAVDYVGFACPDEFLVGYGLDYAGRYRNLPYIGVLDPQAIAPG